MRGGGPVTLSQVERALDNLGGQSTWGELLAELTRLRNGDYSYYLDKRNYQETARQMLHAHCPGFGKYRGQPRFERVGNEYRLSPSKPVLAQSTQTLPEKHTPGAIDVEDQDPPERRRQEINHILRDSALAREVKEAHKYRCQICRQTLRLGDGRPYAEAHHIVPLGAPHNGLDVRGNILCVCPNDHVLLDYGAIKLYESHLDGIDKEFINYHNGSIYGKISA